MNEKTLPSTRFDSFTNAREQRQASRAVPAVRFKADDGSEFPKWEEKRLGDILEIYHGRDYKQLDPGNIPVMGTGGVITYVDEALCDWDCVCIGRKGTINKPIYMTAPFWSVDTLFFTKAKKNHHPLWQYYLFQMINWDRYNEATGVPSLSSTTIESIRISVPSLPEQKKIAALLSSVDETLDLCQRKLDLLTQAKKALMQQIFSRKLRFKADDGANFPDWEVKKLGDVGHVAMCKRVFKDQTLDHGDVPFFKIGTFGAIPDAYISHDLYFELKEKYPYPTTGAILLSASGTIGKQVEYKGEEAYFQDSNIVWLEHDSSVTDAFLKYVYQVVKWAGTEGSTIKRLYNRTILETLFPLPSLPEQKKIASCLSSADALIDQARVELEQWQDVKKSLLQQLFV